MKIIVTREHIETGEPENCHYCPIANAICETLKIGNESVKVDGELISIVEAGKNYMTVYETPENAKEFIGRFDYGLSVEPFELELVENDNS